MISSLSRRTIYMLAKCILVVMVFTSCKPTPEDKSATPGVSSTLVTASATIAPTTLHPTTTNTSTPLPSYTSTIVPTFTSEPDVPSDGYIVFVAEGELYIFNASCTGVPLGCNDIKWDKLTNTPRPEQQFAAEITGDQITASPGGNKIAFAYRESKEHMGAFVGEWDIYILDIEECLRLGGCESQHFTRLTDDPADDISPAWSPRGDLIAFVSNRGPYSHNIQSLYVMRPEGSEQKSVFDNDAIGQISNPSWSPDGDQLVFNVDVFPSGDYHPSVVIYSADVDGSSIKQLTDLPRNPQSPVNKLDWRPQWSPDSKQIVFDSNRDSGLDIYVMNADGSDLKRLSNIIEGAYPHWSPDGTRIAFLSPGYLFVINRDGTNPIQLTDNIYIHNFIWIP